MTNIFFKQSDIFFKDKFIFRKNQKIWLSSKNKFQHRRKIGLEYLKCSRGCSTTTFVTDSFIKWLNNPFWKYLQEKVHLPPMCNMSCGMFYVRHVSVHMSRVMSIFFILCGQSGEASLVGSVPRPTQLVHKILNQCWVFYYFEYKNILKKIFNPLFYKQNETKF